MGITYSSAALLAQAKKNNICFDKILTIGHQYLNVSPKQVKQLAKSYAPTMNTSIFLVQNCFSGYFSQKTASRFLTHAIKTESKSIFSDYPHQSDYLSAYSGDEDEQSVQSI